MTFGALISLVSSFNKPVFNAKGNTLVSVMISFGLMSILSAAMMSMFDSQRKQLKFMEQKEEIGELKRSISRILESPASCKENFDSLVHTSYIFDSTASNLSLQKINLSELKSGSGATASVLISATNNTVKGTRLSSGVVIDKIELFNLTSNSSTEYVGDIQVSFIHESGVTPLKPVTISGQKFIVDTTTPSSTKIIDCIGGSSTQLGVNQTWQNVKPFRLMAAVYQNTTNKPIQVSIDINETNVAGSIASFRVSEDGTNWHEIANLESFEDDGSVQLIIPSGYFYKVIQSGSLPITFNTWYELR